MTSLSIDFTSLYAAEWHRLRRLIKRVVGNGAIAEDLAQDAFVKLSERPLRLEDRGLLFRTGQTLALDHLRASKVRRAYTEDASSILVPSAQPAVEAALEARQELQAFLTALRTLPERTQRVFLMHRLDGLTYPVIAKTLGVSLSTVEKDIVRALLLCRDWQKGQHRQ